MKQKINPDIENLRYQLWWAWFFIVCLCAAVVYMWIHFTTIDRGILDLIQGLNELNALQNEINQGFVKVLYG